jgi:hypothetical protein
VFENLVLGRIFGLKTGEVVGFWRKLHSESFVICILCQVYLNDHVKEDKMGVAYSTHGDKRNVYRILVGKPEGKRPLGISGWKREGNIEMDFREIGWGGMD